MDVWQVAVICCGGLARSARLADNAAEAHRLCVQLRSLLDRREAALTDRWPVESALAWDALLGHTYDPAATAKLQRALGELSRRDVDQWLRLRLETCRISEWYTGKTDRGEREEIRRLGLFYGARAIVAGADEKLSSSAPDR